MKKIISIFAILILCLNFCGCGFDSSLNDQYEDLMSFAQNYDLDEFEEFEHEIYTTTSTTIYSEFSVMESSTTYVEKTEFTITTLATSNTDTENSSSENGELYSNLNAFIAAYNEIAETKITDICAIDIQSDEYYRTEFRLNAYQDVPALKGLIEGNDIQIINSNYGSMFSSDLRIYASTDNIDIATDIFESFCKATDSEISQKSFDEFYQYNSLESGDCRIVIGNVSGSIIKNNGRFDILLDASPSYFDQ